MLRQIRYFQAVVKNNSFSEAAEECHISQSAISQQIKALEGELGFLLLERKKHKFQLTPAGEHFYKKSLILTADYDRICEESKKIAHAEDYKLRIGYLSCYSGQEFQKTVEEFALQHSDIKIEIINGTHEELYSCLRRDEVDIILNDQRRAFSEEYINLELITNHLYVEVSAANPISHLKEIEISDLKNTPCILIAPKSQHETEEEYYRQIVGVQSEIIFTENLEEARLLVISGTGYMPLEGKCIPQGFSTTLKRIALNKSERPITRKYCAFWKKDNSGYYVEEFADILKKYFMNKVS